MMAMNITKTVFTAITLVGVILVLSYTFSYRLRCQSEHFVEIPVSEKNVLSPTHSQSNRRMALSMFTEYTSYKANNLLKHHFADEDLLKRFTIHNNGSDVIVLLRMQKTGSTTMDFHLFSNIDVSPWCRCQFNNCSCFQEWKKNVLFKRSRDEWPCGLHSDWTYTKACAEKAINKRHGHVIKQRHLYVTMVRDPLRRYISEWLHVKRGGYWTGAPYICNGRRATKTEIPPCYTTRTWSGVTLQEFMNCPSNLAVNRQTRMLANLSLVNCYNTSGMSYDRRHQVMVESAKENLKNMAFFGLTSHQQLSQILFENTFNLKFRSKFVDDARNKSYSGRSQINKYSREKIIHLNRYDVLLYQYAKDLFIQRLLKLANTTKNGYLQNLILNKTSNLVRQYENTMVEWLKL